MKTSSLKPVISQQSSVVIRPIKPLIFDFFVSNFPKIVQPTIEDGDIRYQQYSSQRLEHNNSFKPKLSCKKMIEDPNFLLSVERKKIKVIHGLGQRANPERPSRNYYKGSKVRSNTSRSLHQQSVSLQSNKYKRVQSQELPSRSIPKAKTPHFQFNLKHLLQTCKVHPDQFHRQNHITGTNFPYYHHYSTKSPMSKRSSRKSQHTKRDLQRQQYFSSTIQIKPFLS